jgi:hypothetical protein
LALGFGPLLFKLLVDHRPRGRQIYLKYLSAGLLFAKRRPSIAVIRLSILRLEVKYFARRCLTICLISGVVLLYTTARDRTRNMNRHVKESDKRSGPIFIAVRRTNLNTDCQGHVCLRMGYKADSPSIVHAANDRRSAFGLLVLHFSMFSLPTGSTVQTLEVKCPLAFRVHRDVSRPFL